MKYFEHSGERSIAAFAIAAILILVVPAFDNLYLTSILTSVLMFAVPAMGAWLLLNTGIWSFGQGAWALLGSYLTTLTVMKLDLSFWLALPLAAVATGVISWLAASVMLRASGVTFAILSLVVLLTVNQLITLFPDITNGQSGIIGVPMPPPLGIGPLSVSMSDPTALYYLIGVITVIVLGWLVLIWRSPFARVLMSIRDEPALAASLGVPVRHYQATVFALAGSWTALAGGFSATYLSVAHPAVWYIFPSIFIVAYAIIGGIRSPYGALVGSALVIGAGELFRFAENLQPLLVGLGLVIVSIFLPTGVLGIIVQLARRVVPGLRRPGKEDETGPADSSRGSTAVGGPELTKLSTNTKDEG
ncbi:MAG: branched-chain amino acid ABC transporter permease [Microbacteriaceae bacterium]|nr:MAG: branched-chain amino acid ABC transporter permease [Microbacteriaceae bacterium]